MKSLKIIFALFCITSHTAYSSSLPKGIYAGVVQGESSTGVDSLPVIVDFDKKRIWDGGCINTMSITAGSDLSNFQYTGPGCGVVTMNCVFSDAAHIPELKHDGVIVCEGTFSGYPRKLYLSKTPQTALLR